MNKEVAEYREAARAALALTIALIVIVATIVRWL